MDLVATPYNWAHKWKSLKGWHYKRKKAHLQRMGYFNGKQYFSSFVAILRLSYGNWKKQYNRTIFTGLTFPILKGHFLNCIEWHFFKTSLVSMWYTEWYNKTLIWIPPCPISHLPCLVQKNTSIIVYYTLRSYLYMTSISYLSDLNWLMCIVTSNKVQKERYKGQTTSLN